MSQNYIEAEQAHWIGNIKDSMLMSLGTDLCMQEMMQPEEV